MIFVCGVWLWDPHLAWEPFGSDRDIVCGVWLWDPHLAWEPFGSGCALTHCRRSVLGIGILCWTVLS